MNDSNPHVGSDSRRSATADQEARGVPMGVTSPCVGALQIAECALISGLLLSLFDVATSSSRLSAFVLSIGLLAAVPIAAAWALLDALTARWPPRALLLSCALGGCGAGVLLTDSLGAFEKLEGHHAELALGVMLGAPLAGAVLGGVCSLACSAMQPVIPRASGVRTSSAVCAWGLSYCCVWLDENVLVGLYAPAHWGLRSASLVLGTLGVALVWRGRARSGAMLRLRLGWVVIVPMMALLVGASVPSWEPQLGAFLETRPRSRDLVAAMRKTMDADGDGYSPTLGGGDCDDRNAQIHPGAVDIPENGIDENCLLGDRQGHAPGRAAPPAAPQNVGSPGPIARSVVVIVVDALRADRLKDASLVPHLAQWAEGARRYPRAYTAGGWTGLSLPTMFRGVWARRLIWREMFYTVPRFRFVPVDRPDRLDGDSPKEVLTLPIDEPTPTIAQQLARRGVSTVAVVDDGAGEILSKEHFADGYVRYLETDSLPPAQRNDAGTLALAEFALSRLPEDEPFMMWVHLFGVHAPDVFHPELGDQPSTAKERYDHELRFLDTHLERFLGTLDARGGLPLTVFLTGDHGEEFDDQGPRHHGYSVLEDSIHVPLLVKGPQFPAGVDNTLVSTIDIGSTILALFEIDTPYPIDGMDLRNARGQKRVIFTDTWRYSGRERGVDLVAALDGESKVVRNLVTNATRIVSQHPPERPLEPSAKTKALVDALDHYLEHSPFTDHHFGGR